MLVMDKEFNAINFYNSKNQGQDDTKKAPNTVNINVVGNCCTILESHQRQNEN